MYVFSYKKDVSIERHVNVCQDISPSVFMLPVEALEQVKSLYHGILLPAGSVPAYSVVSAQVGMLAGRSRTGEPRAAGHSITQLHRLRLPSRRA